MKSVDNIVSLIEDLEVVVSQRMALVDDESEAYDKYCDIIEELQDIRGNLDAIGDDLDDLQGDE